MAFLISFLKVHLLSTFNMILNLEALKHYILKKIIHFKKKIIISDSPKLLLTHLLSTL